jgi:hypothetical protein
MMNPSFIHCNSVSLCMLSPTLIRCSLAFMHLDMHFADNFLIELDFTITDMKLKHRSFLLLTYKSAFRLSTRL